MTINTNIKITKITKQKKDNRYNIFVDDEYSFAVYESSISKFGLYANKEITSDEIEEIKKIDIEDKLYNYALNLIVKRPRSEKEIKTKFETRNKKQESKQSFRLVTIRLGRDRNQKSNNPDDKNIILKTDKSEILPNGITRLDQNLETNNEDSGQAGMTTIDSVLARLKRNKYLNDLEFAEWWIRNRTEFKPRGKYLLIQELKIKGLDKKLISEAITKFYNIDKEEGNIRDLAEKKLRSLKSNPPQKQKEKLIRFLLSKGFEYDKIKSIVRDILDNQNNEIL